MIKFVSIKNQGSLDTERAIFKVYEDGNIGKRLIFCNKSVIKKDGSKQLQNVIYSAYWFIDKEVEAGDLVVLYTKDTGSNYKVKENADQTKTHFFYWKNEECLWAREGIALVIGVMDDWDTHHINYNDADIEP